MTRSEIRRILQEREIRVTKALGQNFLHDTNQVSRVLREANLQAKDRVLEIGPGLGAFTDRLRTVVCEVFAIEKDHRLFRVLSERYSGDGVLRLLRGDALDYLRDSAEDWSDWKCVSNLPYSVGSPILVELALSRRPPQRIVVIVQLEVARRLMAVSGSSDYGILSLLVQLRYEPVNWFKIPASCFFPEPSVDSAGVVLVRRTPFLIESRWVATFSELVKTGFGQRRKMMFNLLRKNWDEGDLSRAFELAGISPSLRAEALDLPGWVALTRSLVQSAKGEKSERDSKGD